MSLPSCLSFGSAAPLRLTLLLAVLALLAGIRTAQAQDGRAILLKTLQVYQSFNSYSGQANVDTMMIAPNGQTIKHIGSSSVMKLQRPNKIYLFFQTPIGSRSIYQRWNQLQRVRRHAESVSDRSDGSRH